MDDLKYLVYPQTQEATEKAGSMYTEITEPKWHYKLASDMYFSPNYIQAGLIVFMLFLLVLTFARLRHIYVHWSFKGATGMLALGFFLALILEGFLLISGKTVLTGLLGWENPPKPVSTALDTGRKELETVLGESCSDNKEYSALDLITLYDKLDPSESDEVRKNICK